MNSPYEPSADMRTLAKSLWDMYQALTHAGFSEQQSMQIIGNVLSASVGMGRLE